jgi:hypothetical protein
MNKETAKKVRFLSMELEEWERKLIDIDKRSFGLGTSYKDFDDYIRPYAKQFINHKIYEIKSKLELL